MSEAALIALLNRQKDELRQRAEAAEAVAREEMQHRLDLQAKLAEAQQREAWWQEYTNWLEIELGPVADWHNRVIDLRRLLGLEDAK